VPIFIPYNDPSFNYSHCHPPFDVFFWYHQKPIASCQQLFLLIFAKNDNPDTVN